MLLLVMQVSTKTCNRGCAEFDGYCTSSMLSCPDAWLKILDQHDVQYSCIFAVPGTNQGDQIHILECCSLRFTALAPCAITSNTEYFGTMLLL